MASLRRFVLRFYHVVRPGHAEPELARELDSHVQFLEEDFRRGGMTTVDAKRAARRVMGGVEQTKEQHRDARSFSWLDDAGRDLRHAVRGLARNPGFTATIVLTLALGIGATTATFTVVNGVLLRPLPYPDSEALVSVAHRRQNAEELFCSPSMYVTYREATRVFEEFGLWFKGTTAITGLAEPEEVQTVWVTYGTLQALRVPAALGRWFSLEDDTPGTPETVILTYGYWQRRYGGDASVIGRTLTVDTRPREIVGVMPQRFRFLDHDVDIILPARFVHARLLLGSLRYAGIARLKAGVTLDEAHADVRRMVPIWLDAWPEIPGVGREPLRGLQPVLRSLKDDVVGEVSDLLWIVLATMGGVLLIACANIANLWLVHVDDRRRELGMRAVLGAGRTRLARQLLTECLVLGMTGGALGLCVAHAALTVLAALRPEGLPRLTNIALDPIALGFAVAASLVSSVLFGAIPLVTYSRTSRPVASQAEARTLTDSSHRHRIRNGLVVVQVALALVLLVWSGLMFRTLQSLRSVPPGFTDPGNLQLARISVPYSLVQEHESVVRMLHEMLETVASLSRVSSVAFASAAPMEGLGWGDPILIERTSTEQVHTAPIRQFRFVSPGFFQATGTRLVAGRDISWSDIYDYRPVVLVSESLARELWGAPMAALGQRVRGLGARDAWREIIGVVGDVYDEGVHRPVTDIVYWPVLLERAFGNERFVQRSLTLAVRSSRADTPGFLRQLQHAIWGINASVPVTVTRTLQDVYDRSMARTLFTVVMLGAAGAMALLLGIVGVYGVVSYTVGRRTREIAIRMALGARAQELTRKFVWDGLMVTGVGVTVGLITALSLTQLIASLLFGVTPLDPSTYAVVGSVLLLAAALASFIPAHRITRLDPMIALRCE